MSVKSEATALANALLERDDIGSLPIPTSAKRYARMRSPILFKQGGTAKEKLYIDQVADTTGQADKKQGFRNFDGSAYTSKEAKKKEPKLEAEGAQNFMRKHGITQSRTIRVERDPSHENWFRIPVFDRNRRMWSMFRPKGNNAKQEMKEKLQKLVRNRSGFRPGDCFMSPFGHFLVSDSLSIVEV